MEAPQSKNEKLYAHVSGGDNHTAAHGKSASKKSFDQLAREQGVKTFNKNS